MIRHLKRYFAIRSYMMRLGGELVRRFGQRPVYTVDQVTQAVQRGGFSTTFIAYAHAAYCPAEDFNAHYEPMQVACNYPDLRKVIARRYFSGRTDFDARSIFQKFGRAGFNAGNFHESGIGITGTDAAGH